MIQEDYPEWPLLDAEEFASFPLHYRLGEDDKEHVYVPSRPPLRSRHAFWWRRTINRLFRKIRR